MKVKLVEIVNDDTGWKGTWYRKGERHFVCIEPLWPDVHACKYTLIGKHNGGIHENDCTEIRGMIAGVKCAVKYLLSIPILRGRQRFADSVRGL